MKQFSCAAVRRNIDAYLDGELSAKKAERLASHLDTCSDCSAYFEQRKQIIKLLRESAVSPAPGFTARVMYRIGESALYSSRTAASAKRPFPVRTVAAWCAGVVLCVAAFGVFAQSIMPKLDRGEGMNAPSEVLPEKDRSADSASPEQEGVASFDIDREQFPASSDQDEPSPADIALPESPSSLQEADKSDDAPSKSEIDKSEENFAIVFHLVADGDALCYLPESESDLPFGAPPLCIMLSDPQDRSSSGYLTDATDLSVIPQSITAENSGTFYQTALCEIPDSFSCTLSPDQLVISLPAACRPDGTAAYRLLFPMSDSTLNISIEFSE